MRARRERPAHWHGDAARVRAGRAHPVGLAHGARRPPISDTLLQMSLRKEDLKKLTDTINMRMDEVFNLVARRVNATANGRWSGDDYVIMNSAESTSEKPGHYAALALSVYRPHVPFYPFLAASAGVEGGGGGGDAEDDDDDEDDDEEDDDEERAVSCLPPRGWWGFSAALMRSTQN